MLRTHDITGGGGVRLHAVEAGRADGTSILFIHGFSQCALAWSRQLDSPLASDFRLVAFDLRGHGLSDRPRDGYGDSRLWADDVNAVIRTLRLDRPILCGWSYGGLVIFDYVRHYGSDAIGGVQLVDAITKLGSDEALEVLTPEFLSLVPGFFSSNVEESIASLRSLLRMCGAEGATAEEQYLMLGYNVSVPPRVREALFSRAVDNDDLLAGFRRPVLLTHGADDVVVKRLAVERHRGMMPHAEVFIVPGAGHAPFRDQARAFNERLRDFAAQRPDQGARAAPA